VNAIKVAGRRRGSQAEYVANDDHWALVAYRPGKPIRVAVIDQGDLYMPRDQEDLCEQAAPLQLTFPDRQFLIVRGSSR
jgi:hypothetical protein